MISLAFALCIFIVPDWKLRSSIPAPATVKWIEDELFLVMGRMLTKLDPLLCCNAASSNSRESFSSFLRRQSKKVSQSAGTMVQTVPQQTWWMSLWCSTCSEDKGPLKFASPLFSINNMHLEKNPAFSYLASLTLLQLSSGQQIHSALKSHN